LIPDVFPVGTEGTPVQTGETIGYQAMWAGRANQQAWLHVTLGIAPYDPLFLEDLDLLEGNLVHPGDYFGIQIDTASENLKPIICLD
jgi:hypothetical protein